MTQDKRGLLMVWTDIPPDAEAAFNEWYNREHMPDRINKVPGFVRARRFIALSGSPRYLALYETRSAQVFRSESYLAINREPDPTSRRFIPLFRNTVKCISEIEVAAGQGAGCFLALLPVTVENARQPSFEAWLRDTLFPQTLAGQGVISATYARRNAEAQGTAAASYTRAGDRFVDGIIAIETAHEHDLAAACAALAPATLSAQGCNSCVVDQPATFRMIYAVHAGQ